MAPASAALFVEQAKKAGVDVKVVKKNPFYGDDYLSYPFGQDFWNTRNYLPQAAVGVLKGGTYNETHLDKAPEYPKFAELIASAAAEVDETKRNSIAPGRPGDRVRRGRLHHLGLPHPGRRRLARRSRD